MHIDLSSALGYNRRAAIIRQLRSSLGIMSEAFVLEARKREVVGKKVKLLRAKGEIPAVVYGPKQDPVKIAVSWLDLRPVLRDAGGTNLIEINVDGDKYMTLARIVDRHPVYPDRVLHVDFYAVDMAATIVTSVPVILDNQAETEERIEARIVLDLPGVEVESLPSAIPSQIVVDVSVLEEIGDQITVADLPVIEGVSYFADPETLVVRTAHIGSLPEEEEEEEGEEDLEFMGDEMAEPEVISRGKQEDEDEEE